MIIHTKNLIAICVIFTLTCAASENNEWKTLVPDCIDTVIKQTPSPDRKYVAYYYERNCGSTTPLSYIVSIQLSSEKFEGGIDQNIVMVAEKASEVGLEWESPQKLNIKVKAEKFFKTEKGLDEITINYKKAE